MLPALRKDDYLYPVPKFDLKKCDIKGFTNGNRSRAVILINPFDREEASIFLKKSYDL